MHSKRLRSALAAASAMLALAAVPAYAQGPDPSDAFVPGEAIVGLEGGGTTVAELPAGTPVAEGIAQLERNPEIRFATPNWIAHASVDVLDQGAAGTPGGWREDQWSFLGKPGGIHVAPAWDELAKEHEPGGLGTTVAVVDTGLAYASAPGYLPSPDFGISQFVSGIDLVDDDGAPLDENGHGTHVAGTIAEEATWGQPAAGPDYLTGIAYGARLMPIRVLDAEGVGGTDDVATGILWAARNGAEVINLSLNFDPMVDRCSDVPTVCTAIRKARKAGALVVGAAGNALDANGKHRALFPAGASDAFGVGATTEHGCLAAYSHYGKRTDLLAPGGGAARGGPASRPECAHDSRPVLQLTYACFPMDCTGGREAFAIRPDIGTSMSAAHASGVAALVISSGVVGGDPSPERVAERLQCTARPRQPERYYGVGLLDAARAVDPHRDCGRPSAG